MRLATFKRTETSEKRPGKILALGPMLLRVAKDRALNPKEPAPNSATKWPFQRASEDKRFVATNSNLSRGSLDHLQKITWHDSQADGGIESRRPGDGWSTETSIFPKKGIFIKARGVLKMYIL
jgi:hypothetical protein